MARVESDYTNFFPQVRQTRLPGGYMGKILRIDLNAGKFTDLNLPEEPLLRKYWGGQLFAEYVLLNELPAAIDPFDTKNIIVGMTGPVTGTGFTPGGTKICFVYLSPATRYTLGRAATSGYFGTSLKAASISASAQRKLTAVVRVTVSNAAAALSPVSEGSAAAASANLNGTLNIASPFWDGRITLAMFAT